MSNDSDVTDALRDAARPHDPRNHLVPPRCTPRRRYLALEPGTSHTTPP